jgi:hypothetical protein
MLRNGITGVLEREMCRIPIEAHGSLVQNAYVTEDGGVFTIRLILTVDGGIKDWEYEAIYDYYDPGTFAGLGLEITEKPEFDNPAWEFAFPFIEDEDRLAGKINGIIHLHSREVKSVLAAIKEAEGDYNVV